MSRTDVFCFALTVGSFVAVVCSSPASSNPSNRRATPPEGATVRNAWDEKVVHAFKGAPDGSAPFAGVVADSVGALYGVTNGGGTANQGAVYKLTPSGSKFVEHVIYSFKGGVDGSSPQGTLLVGGRGAIFGATNFGGTSSCGTIFRLTPESGNTYRKVTLYSFKCQPDGQKPFDGVIADAAGDLYGTTYYGGSKQNGTVFELKPKGGVYSETVIHSFQGGSDGIAPAAGLVADSSGILYGETQRGGNAGFGTVYKISPTAKGFQESVVYAFRGGSDAGPQSRLIVDGASALYGTSPGIYAQSEVFKLTRAPGHYLEQVLYQFSVSAGTSLLSGLLADAAGDLYGVTVGGGSMNQGMAYELVHSASGYTLSVLYNFTFSKGGALPEGTLIQDSSGTLYGTAMELYSTFNGCVFKLSPKSPR